MDLKKGSSLCGRRCRRCRHSEAPSMTVKTATDNMQQAVHFCVSILLVRSLSSRMSCVCLCTHIEHYYLRQSQSVLFSAFGSAAVYFCHACHWQYRRWHDTGTASGDKNKVIIRWVCRMQTQVPSVFYFLFFFSFRLACVVPSFAYVCSSISICQRRVVWSSMASYK